MLRCVVLAEVTKFVTPTPPTIALIMKGRCCVPGCKSGIKMPSHHFPKDPQRCSTWIKSLTLDCFHNYTSTQMQKYKVCYKHFRPEDYSPCLRKRFLLNIAIPLPLVVNDNIDTPSVNSSDNVDTLSVNSIDTVSVNDSINNIHVSHCRSVITENKEQHLQCANNEDRNVPLSTEESNILEEYNVAIAEREELIDCNVQKKACNSAEPEQQDELNSVLQNYGHRLQTLEMQMATVTTTQRRQLQAITRYKNLSPISRRLYDINIKLKRRNRYWKRVAHKKKQEKTKKRSVKRNIANTANNTAAVRENFVQMILRNNDIHPKV